MEPVDFFVSYTKQDSKWAEWIAWVLEKADYDCCIQAWDFAPGTDFMRKMREAIETTKQVVIVLSPEYLASPFATAELDAALARDPNGTKGFLVPVRVKEFEPGGLLRSRVYIDLVGKREVDAQTALLQGIKASRVGRSKPGHVGFPVPPAFPLMDVDWVPGTPAVRAPLERVLLLAGAHVEMDELQEIASTLSGTSLETRVVIPIGVEDLAQEIAATQADIIHLNAHMDGEHVLLQSRTGEVRALDYMAFIGMLRVGKSPVRLVYLNACLSFELAKALTTFADAAIGIPGDITVKTAKAVATHFYRELALGHTIPDALTRARSAVETRFPDAHQEDLPRLALKSEVSLGSLVVPRQNRGSAPQ